MKGKTMGLAIRLIILLVGIIFFVRFAIPVPLKGVLNIGNVTGMGCSVILILYGIFFTQINHFFVWAWKYVPGKIGCLLAGLLMIALIATVAVETILMVRAAVTHKVKDESATVVVLGAKAHADHPSELLQSRLDAAITYLTEHPNAIAVLSGGQGEDEPITEAQCMFDYLTKKGIAAERLYLEDASADTKENIINSIEIIQANQLNPSIVIITNEFHEYRATLLANSMSLDYSVYAADTPAWALPTYYVRELYGILKEWSEML